MGGLVILLERSREIGASVKSWPAFSHRHSRQKARTTSVHPRTKGGKTPEIETLHFWVKLSAAPQT